MKLSIDWEQQIELKNSKIKTLLYTLDLDKVTTNPGVYIFGRRFNKTFEALYVGKGNNIRSRIKTQLNNLKLMQHIKNAKDGKRVLICGFFNAKQGQKNGKGISLIEKALIRHYLYEGHDIVNKQGVSIRNHEILSSGKINKKIIPRMIYLAK